MSVETENSNKMHMGEDRVHDELDSSVDTEEKKESKVGINVFLFSLLNDY